jgi:excisionase family DNA binding protein
MVAMPMTDDRWLTVEQVADEMQVNPETVRRWLRAGRLRGFQPGGTKIGWRVPTSELRRFMNDIASGEERQS